jgi:hypothetical protein
LGQNLIYEDFVEPKDKKPSLTADADYKYKQLLERYNDLHHPKLEPGYFDFPNLVYQNHFHYILGYVKSHLGQPYPKNSSTFIKHA